MTTETITWRRVEDAMPDTELNVLCFDEESMLVCAGFFDGAGEDGQPVWRDVTAMELGIVTYWADMPYGPDVPDV
jgi:hypothetical protein